MVKNGLTIDQKNELRQKYAESFGITVFNSNNKLMAIEEYLPKGISFPTEEEYKLKFWKNSENIPTYGEDPKIFYIQKWINV